MAIIALALLVAVRQGFAQSDAAQVLVTSDDPFATIHSELNETADSVLAQSIQQMAEAAEMNRSRHDPAIPRITDWRV